MPKKVANGEAIRSIRELAGFSQMAFAEAIGVSRPALAKVEAGGGMRPRNLKRAAEVLGVPITSLTKLDESEPAEVAS
jgi:transcriptional regulator with XRE-family HTH domain